MDRFSHDMLMNRELEMGLAGGRRHSLARALLLTVIAALCIAALVAIGLLLFGNFGETEGKILLTTLAIAGYSLLGLAATTALGRETFWLGSLGLGVSAIGFVLFVSLIWINPQGDLLGRLMGTFLVLAIAIAHAALLLLLTRRGGERGVLAVRRLTLLTSSALSLMIIFPIVSGWEPGQLYARAMGAVAVLTVLGSLLVPVLRKLAGETSAPEAETEARDRLEIRYRDRTFVVQTYRAQAGFAIDAWEVVKGARAPSLALPQTAPFPDGHAALAFAVQHITSSVDDEDLPRQRFATRRGAARPT